MRKWAAAVVLVASLGVWSAAAADPATPTADQVAQLKAQRDRAVAMNVLIKQANDAVTAKQWGAAIDPLEQLVAMNPPDAWVYLGALGDAHLGVGQYDQAADAYTRGVAAARAAQRGAAAADAGRLRAAIAHMLTNLGNANLKLRKTDAAIAAFTEAASLDPNPATAYFNLCATQYNAGNVEGALAACNKAIAADPARADAYFIKGSLMLGDAKMTADGKMVAPAGTVEALEHYLTLAPNGPHVGDVRQMLDALGVKTTP